MVLVEEINLSEAKKMATLEKNKNSIFTFELKQLRSELERVKVELTNYKTGEEERQVQEKKDFLELEDFFDILGNHPTFMFKHGFNKAIQQLKEVGYPHKGAPSDFINLSNGLDSLLEEIFGSRWPFYIYAFYSYDLYKCYFFIVSSSLSF